jgi:CPA1 family monovalent cation:H+ antiporter
VFLLNGFVFILIGLQLTTIIEGLGSYSVGEAIGYAIVISLLTIIIRIIWVFPNAYIPRILFKSIRDTEPRPTWQAVLMVAWSGMRGVVSLASALAIPLTLTSGESFPHRNLILFITFVVILFTLVLQGLSLKPLIRVLKVEVNRESEKVQELSLRIHLAEAVLAYLDTNYQEQIQGNETYKRVRDRYERMIEVSKKRLEKEEVEEEGAAFLPQYRKMLVELVEVRRRELNRFRHANEYNEELLREREWEAEELNLYAFNDRCPAILKENLIGFQVSGA